MSAAHAADLDRRVPTAAPAGDAQGRAGDRASGAAAARAPTVAEQQRQTLVDLYLQVDQLQNEIRQLRGQVETLTFELERLKARNRDTASDLDRRVRELERRAPAAAAAEGAAGEVTLTDKPVAAAAPAAATATEQQEYDAAFQLMRSGAYDQAIKEFREFLARHPRSELADNAQYWIGEALYVVRNFKSAVEEFGKVVADYPGSDKAPDAQLKVGYSYLELGDRNRAREALAQAAARYPNSRAAKTAEKRLADMKKEKK
jgi:tol-pal system protein YbgF